MWKFPNIRNLHNSITKKHRKCTDLKEKLKRTWQQITVYKKPFVLATMGIIPNKLHQSLKLLNLGPALHILIQKAATLNTCRTARKFLVEQWIRSTRSVWPVLFWELAKPLWSKESGLRTQCDTPFVKARNIMADCAALVVITSYLTWHSFHKHETAYLRQTVLQNIYEQFINLGHREDVFNIKADRHFLRAITCARNVQHQVNNWRDLWTQTT
jgi:hypothetical protein